MRDTIATFRHDSTSSLIKAKFFPNSHSLAIVCYAEALKDIPDSFWETAKAAYLIDHNPAVHDFFEKPDSNSSFRLPLHPLKDLEENYSCDVAFFHPHYTYSLLVAPALRLLPLGIESFYNCMPIPYNVGITTTHIPDYYTSNQKNLKDTFQRLQDEKSKRIFASRIRALETGNVGYVELSEYPEYFHPEVQPANGDIVIDGGVSANIRPQVMFSNAVGEKGKIYGFEPDPVGLCEANDQLEKTQANENYKLIPLGLWDKKDTLFFELNGQGTHVDTTQNTHSVRCDVVSIDEFVSSSRIKKVDFIKLDVEGAEANVLKGLSKQFPGSSPNWLFPSTTNLRTCITFQGSSTKSMRNTIFLRPAPPDTARNDSVRKTVCMTSRIPFPAAITSKPTRTRNTRRSCRKHERLVFHGLTKINQPIN